MTYKKAYYQLASLISSLGWKVREVNIKNYWGAISFEEKTIVIGGKLSFKIKLKTLAHEVGHALQYQNKEFRTVLAGYKLKDTKKNRQLVIDSEIDASEKGMKLLKIMGFNQKQIQYEEFDKKLLKKYLIKTWLKDHIELKKPL